MSSYHQSKDKNTSLSRYTSTLARPSRRASLLRPSTARPSTANSIPSPTAAVFVVSRKGASNPEPEPLQHRKSFSNISNWVQTIEPGTPPPLSPINNVSSRSSRRQSTPATSPIKPHSHHPNTMSHQYAVRAPEFLNAPPPSTCASESKSSRFGFMKRSKSTAPAPKKQPSQPSHSYTKGKPLSRENIPPALMSELLLMQYTGGGSIETHLNRVLEAQAKKSAKSGQSPAIGGIYRDEEGRIWWDEAEKVEYDSLLGDRRPSVAESYVDFGDEGRHRSRTRERRRPSAIQIPTPAQPESFFDDSFVPRTAPIKDSKKSSSRSHVRGIFGMH